MQIFNASDGHRLIMLNAGERVPDLNSFSNFNGATIVWPRKSGKWDIRLLDEKTLKWVPVTDQLFETQNAAFNFAYDLYCQGRAQTKKLY